MSSPGSKVDLTLLSSCIQSRRNRSVRMIERSFLIYATEWEAWQLLIINIEWRKSGWKGQLNRMNCLVAKSLSLEVAEVQGYSFYTLLVGRKFI